MDLKDCLKKMDAAGRLAHVHTEVDAVHELSGVAAKLDGGKAVVFEHVKGYDYPVSTGMWWNRENVAAIRPQRGCASGALCRSCRLSAPKPRGARRR